MRAVKWSMIAAGSLVAFGLPLALFLPEDRAVPGQEEGMTSQEEVRTDSSKVFQLSPRRQQLIGVTTVPAEERDLVRSIRTVGRIEYDERRLAYVNLKFSGWIEKLFVDYTGRPVRRGEPLFTIYSPDLVSTQEEYLLALETRREVGVNPYPVVRAEAESLASAARQRLLLWDLTEQQVRELEETGRARRTVPILSPLSGHVIEKTALQGTYIQPGMDLYKIADLSVVWVYADIYESELPFVAVGQPATVTLSYLPGEEFRGRVTYVYPYLEEATRTVKVRFEVPNPDLLLKPGMFAEVRLEIPVGRRLVIPGWAVLDSGTRQMVFVDQGGGFFEARPVKVGLRTDSLYEVRAGLKPGELVVSRPAFLLDAESRLAAAAAAFAPPAGEAIQEAPRMEILLETDPSPPRTGETRFMVTAKTPEGEPVTGAATRITVSMPAMPGMPAMSFLVELAEVRPGRYEGTGAFPVGGSWTATVVVTPPEGPPASARVGLNVR